MQVFCCYEGLEYIFLKSLRNTQYRLDTSKITSIWSPVTSEVFERNFRNFGLMFDDPEDHNFQHLKEIYENPEKCTLP